MRFSCVRAITPSQCSAYGFRTLLNEIFLFMPKVRGYLRLILIFWFCGHPTKWKKQVAKKQKIVRVVVSEFS